MTNARSTIHDGPKVSAPKRIVSFGANAQRRVPSLLNRYSAEPAGAPCAFEMNHTSREPSPSRSVIPPTNMLRPVAESS